jgi:hypothetical protein
MTRITPKTAHFLETISANPGITTAQLHRAIGGDYAHGHHKYTYDTIKRMRSNALVITRGKGANGGAALYAADDQCPEHGP